MSKKFCKSCKTTLLKSDIYNSLCQKCYKRKELIQYREKYSIEKKEETFKELKNDIIEGKDCFRCHEKTNLIECKILARARPMFTPIRLKQMRFCSSNFICFNCFKQWLSSYEEVNEKLLKNITRFVEIPLKEQIVFHIRKEGIWLVFFKNTITVENYNLIHKLKNLKQKVFYAKGKGYNIPFWQPFGMEYYHKKISSPLFYHSNLDKYGNYKTKKETSK